MYQQRLEIIKKKVEALLEENNRLSAELVAKSSRINELESTVELQKNTLSELTEQNKIIKLAKNFPKTGADGFDMKIKINELVREIDRCIDLLNE
jgi:hypothetical protein